MRGASNQLGRINHQGILPSPSAIWVPRFRRRREFGNPRSRIHEADAENAIIGIVLPAAEEP